MSYCNMHAKIKIFAVQIFLVLILAVPKVWALDIIIKSEPPLPVSNLVTNPGIERGSGGRPLAWRFGTAMPDNFQTGWRDGGRSGKCLWLKASSGKMSGYWSQSIHVEPGKVYLFKGYYRLAGGRILCYAHARKRLKNNRSAVINERFYAGSMRGHWLVPVFLPPDALAGPNPSKWYQFQLRVKVPESIDTVTLSLGMYFTPGEVSFDDVWFGLAESDLKIKVLAAKGEAIHRVTVYRTDSKQSIFDSKSINPPRAAFQCKLLKQPATESYRVEVALSDGHTITKIYPSTSGE